MYSGVDVRTDTIAGAISVLQPVGHGLTRAEVDEVGVIPGNTVSTGELTIRGG